MKAAAAAAAKLLQSCPTLCNPINGSPPGSPIPGVLQARTMEWVAISFSSAWKWKVQVKSLSRLQLLVTPSTAASQAPPSMGFSRQEYWSGVPLPSPAVKARSQQRNKVYFGSSLPGGSLASVKLYMNLVPLCIFQEPHLSSTASPDPKGPVSPHG